MRPEIRTYLALIVGIIGIDQLSKVYIYTSMAAGETRQILGDFLRFTFVFNPGGAFGTIIGNMWVYLAASVTASIIVIVYFVKVPREHKFAKICLAVVIGGALGNLVDRLIYSGKVVDFIDVNMLDIIIHPFKLLFINFPGFEIYRWYIFNIADAAISIGLIGFIVYLLLQEKFEPKTTSVNPLDILPNGQSDIKADSTGE